MKTKFKSSLKLTKIKQVNNIKYYIKLYKFEQNSIYIKIYKKGHKALNIINEYKYNKKSYNYYINLAIADVF